MTVHPTKAVSLTDVYTPIHGRGREAESKATDDFVFHRREATPARHGATSIFRNALLGVLTICFCMLVPNIASSQTASAKDEKAGTYPNRVIRLIVPYAAGGNADVVSRIIGTKLSAQLGQPVIIDNRAGAGGNIGAELAARAAPDGYTLLLGTNTHAINMSLYAKPGYDFSKDFVPISPVSSAPLMLIIHPSVPAGTTREFIALAKSKPGQLNYGTGGSGNSAHIIMELFKTAAGADIVHVPYRGVAQATTDLLGGQVQAMFNSTSTAMDHVRAGRVKALGVSSAQRSPLAPGVPTIAESGFPGFEATIWQGVLAPAGTPRIIIERLNREITSLLASEDFKKQMIEQGVVPFTSTPDQFHTYIKSEIEKWSKVVKTSGAVVD